jgi:selenophosphate synthetase-related protein
MSYHCDKCDAVHEGSELRVVTEVREVEYIKNIQKRIGKGTVPVRDPDGITHGQEIVREVRCCTNCFNSIKDAEPIIITKQQKSVEYVAKPRKVVEEELRQKENDYKEYGDFDNAANY